MCIFVECIAYIIIISFSWEWHSGEIETAVGRSHHHMLWGGLRASWNNPFLIQFSSELKLWAPVARRLNPCQSFRCILPTTDILTPAAQTPSKFYVKLSCTQKLEKEFTMVAKYEALVYGQPLNLLSLTNLPTTDDEAIRNECILFRLLLSAAAYAHAIIPFPSSNFCAKCCCWSAKIWRWWPLFETFPVGLAKMVLKFVEKKDTDTFTR